jgi:uncharacterized protein (TIGR02145 family)
MKKIIITTCLILLIMGCKQEEERRLSILQKDHMEIRGVLPTGEDVSTRTTLDTDGLLTLWEEGDTIGVYGNGSSNVSLTLTSGAGTPFGVFRGAQTGVPVGAYYPYTGSAGDNYREVHGTLDSEQVQNENASQIAPYDWKISSSITGNDQDGYRIHFREIMTMLDINIDVSGTALVGETLGSVTLCVPDRKLAGDFTINLGNPFALPMMDEQASDRVRVRLENPPLLETGEIINARMFMNAAIQSGDPLQIILETENHISTTTVQSAKTMQAGHRNYITLSLSAMTDQTIIYEKFTDSRDGKAYKKVTIASQIWMAENLAYLPTISLFTTGSDSENHYYVYDYRGEDIKEAKATSNYATYGVLYNWPAAITACPEGWHLPSDDEWAILQNNLGGKDLAGGKMKESGTLHWREPNSGATNESGFTGLPGGFQSSGSTNIFNDMGSESRFWSSKASEPVSVWSLEYDTAKLNFYTFANSTREPGYSVRCIKGYPQPNVTTGEVTNITTSSASCTGNVTEDGSLAITARGICWSTSEYPTIVDSKSDEGTGLGSFTSDLTGLHSLTKYYVRAYVTNSEGTYYGEQVIFRTQQEDGGSTFTDSRDNNVYKMLLINDMVWMAENLAYLPSVSPQSSWSNSSPYYYVYDYASTSVTDAKSTNNYSTYGVLYNQTAALSACPPGWHLPSYEEWQYLTSFLGGQEEAGGKMKESGTTHWQEPNTGATNESGFTGIPAGEYSASNNRFSGIGRLATFSMNYNHPNIDYCLFLEYNSTVAPYAPMAKGSGFSVRCVKNILPIVFTSEISNFSNNTACCSSNVYFDGGDTNPPVRGVCWSTSQNPTIADSKTTDGTGLGTYTSNITGLSPNTTYYVKAYATNSEGTSYGIQLYFTTLNTEQAPLVTTGEVMNITMTSATCLSNISSDGGLPVTERGICWSLSENPTISDSKTTNGTGVGSYTGILENLSPNNIYYVRAYATNSKGIGYGEQKSFATLIDYDIEYNEFTDNRDARTYKYVQIGNQEWMAENMSYLPAVNPLESGSEEEGKETDPYYYIYDYNGTDIEAAKATDNFNTYGVLYNWYAALTACPEGWHLPNNEEFMELITFLGGQHEAGGKMKEPGIIHWFDPNRGATNESGFSALPGGGRGSNVFMGTYFGGLGSQALFWSSSKRETSEFSGFMGCTNPTIFVELLEYTYTNTGCSIRCIKGYGQPFVTTGEIYVKTLSASCSAVVLGDGGQEVTARGVCWSTSQNPTLVDSKTTDGMGLGAYTSNITGLSPNTTYYVRAYATNAKGTAYGEQKTFTTNSELTTPTVTTGDITNITTTTATCSGNVTSEGGIDVTTRGVCWSTSENPTILDSKTTDGTGLGTYTSNITGLSPNTTYYVRAYATNSEGIAYGEQKSFQTYDLFTDSRDSRVYKMKTIGEQVWMAENLAYLPSVEGPATVSSSNPYYYVYGYDGTDVDEAKATSNYQTYGVLYNWLAAMNGTSSSNTNPSGVQGICPEGWHLPSDAEWKQLEIHLGMSQEEADDSSWRGTDEGGKLKEAGTSHWNSPNEGADNSSGFTGLPGGSLFANGFYEIGNTGIWWSATEEARGYAWNRMLTFDHSNVYSVGFYYSAGFSVRCLRDSD